MKINTFTIVVIVAVIITSLIFFSFNKSTVYGEVEDILSVSSGGWGSSDKAIVKLTNGEKVIVNGGFLSHIGCLKVGSTIFKWGEGYVVKCE